MVRYLSIFSTTCIAYLASASTVFTRYVCLNSTIARLAYFLAGNILIKGFSFLTVPLLMHYMSPADIALYGMYNTSVMLLSTLLSFGLRQVLWLEYYVCTFRHELLKNIIYAYFLLSFPLCILLCACMTLLWQQEYSFLIILIISAAWLSFFPELLYQWLIYTKQIKLLITTQFFGTASIGIVLLLLYYHGLLYNWHPCVALLTGTLLQTGIACIYFHNILKSIQITFKAETLTKYLKLGLPFIPTILANWCIISAQRYLIANQCSLHQAGLYSIIDLMHQICSLLILQPTATIVLPEIFERFSKTNNLMEENKQIINLMWIAMLGLLIMGTISYFPLSHLAQYILPVHYLPALYLTLLAYVGNIFLWGTYFLQCFAQYKQKTFFLSTSLCMSGVISIVCSYVLIPLFGLAGAAYATTIAYGIYFLVCYRVNQCLSAR